MTSARFYTPEWLAIYQEELQKLFDAAGEEARTINFTMAEVYKEAPAHIAADGTAYVTTEVVGGQVRVRPEPTDRFNVRITAIWEDAVKSVSQIGPEYEEFRAWRFQNGRLGFEGDPAAIPALIAPLHDAMARRTIS